MKKARVLNVLVKNFETKQHTMTKEGVQTALLKNSATKAHTLKKERVLNNIGEEI